ncbi:MAG: tetratricopeptide repeat protein [Syntrophobacter sp.]
MRREKLLLAALASVLVCAVVLAYSNHFQNGFQFDDSHVIQNNLHLRSLSNIPKFFTDATTFSSLPANQSYRPVLTTIFAILYRAGGGTPRAFQIFSFLSYMVLWIILFFLFRRIFRLADSSGPGGWAALPGTAFYMLHAANAETVNYISAQSDLLSTLFMAASLLLYISRPGLRKYCLYLVPAGLAVITKEVSIIFPLLLLAYILLFESDPPSDEAPYTQERARLKRALLMIAPSLIVCCALMLLSSVMLPKTYTPSTTSRLEYILAQPFVIVHYFNTFLLPMNLSADTDWKPLTNPFDDRVLTGIIFIAALAILAVIAARKQRTRPISFGLIWFLAGVLPPSSGVVPLAEVMNDHRMFLPFIGLAMSSTWGVSLAINRRWESIRNSLAMRAAIVLLISAVLAGHAYGTYQRNKVWNNDESLWLDVTRKSPANPRGLMNYGLTQLHKGDARKALDYFNKALLYSPAYSYLHVNIAIARAHLGEHAIAEAHFKRALELNQNYHGAYYFYARFLNDRNRIPEAIPLLRKSIALSPGFTESRYLLMQILASMGNTAGLREAAQDTLKYFPEDPAARFYLAQIREREADD